MDLDLVRIECDVIADNPLQLTAVLYKTLRNYGSYIKAACCSDLHNECNICSMFTMCPYLIAFAQQLSSDPEIVRHHQKPSLPFSLYISTIDSNTSYTTIGLTIIGSMVNYVKIFHSALISMIESAFCTVQALSEFKLKSYCLDYNDNRYEITGLSSLTENVILLSARHVLQNSVKTESVRLTFTSPLRLISNGAIANQFDFSSFYRSQLRRCSSLWAYYGNGELDLDYASLSRAAQLVDVLENRILYSKMAWLNSPNMGLTGVIEFTGLVEPMYSLLLLGSYFNAGKGASYGAGKHNIESLQ